MEAEHTDLVFDRERDIPKLRALADRGVLLGTSSWNYPGWLNQVYCGDYSGPRKSFVKSVFERASLHDYAEVFPTVCQDAGYYSFPNTTQLTRYYNAIPEHCKFSLKVTDLITARHKFNSEEKVWLRNPDFMEARLFNEHFLPPVIESLREKLGTIIFEYSPFFFGKSFGVKDGYDPYAFVADLAQFLDKIEKPEGIQYAVEVRDPELIDPQFGEYLALLSSHKIAHVLNEQTWMQPIREQLKVPGILTANFIVFRALCPRGITHERAVQMFKEYERTKKPDWDFRIGQAELIHLALSTGRKLSGYTNNRREGNAPNTIANVVGLYEHFHGPLT